LDGFGVLLGSAIGSNGAGTTMDHTQRTMVVRRKQMTIVYMKYGHVSSNLSELAVGTGRVALLAAWSVLPLASVVAITSPAIGAAICDSDRPRNSGALPYSRTGISPE